MVGKIPASEIVRVLPAVLGQRRRNGEIAPTPTPTPTPSYLMDFRVAKNAAYTGAFL